MNEKSNRERFKDYLRKIASGEETSRAMTRKESSDALELILKGIPTPAQIGAFMIAHRIRRPEPQELAGMIDTYLRLGPEIKSDEGQQRPLTFGMPFDGRTKKSPIYPLTALILISQNQPVILQGANRIPIKYGVTSQELLRSLGLNLAGLSIKQVQIGFSKHNFALIHQPDHFPLAEKLVSYRDEIGKRPPLASMELIWTSHKGEHLLISGFVHLPTEKRHIQTLKLLNEKEFLTIRGLEGGIDIPMHRTTRPKLIRRNQMNELTIKPQEYDLFKEDLEFEDLEKWRSYSLQALNGKGPLKEPLIWNAGVYLWLAEQVKSISEGIEKAKMSIDSGLAKETLQKLINWRNSLI